MPNMASSWPILGPGTTQQLSFSSSIDATKLEEARYQLSRMDYSRQDEDGDT